MQRLRVVSAALANSCNQRRPEYPGKSPGREHQSVDRAYVRGPKVVGSKSRHGAEPTAVTKQNDECQGGECRKAGDVSNEPKQRCLEKKHSEEHSTPPHQIGEPSPEKAPSSVR